MSIAVPGERAFPESITSTRDGTLFVGRLGEGGVVRADPRTGLAALFVAPGAAGSRSITANQPHGESNMQTEIEKANEKAVRNAYHVTEMKDVPLPVPKTTVPGVVFELVKPRRAQRATP